MCLGFPCWDFEFSFHISPDARLGLETKCSVAAYLLLQALVCWSLAADDVHQTKDESQTNEGARCLHYETKRFKAGPHDAGAKDSAVA